MMMTDDHDQLDGPPSNKRVKIASSGLTEDNAEFDLSALNDLPDTLLDGDKQQVLQTPPLSQSRPNGPERLQHLTALLSNNPPHHPASIGGNNYHGSSNGNYTSSTTMSSSYGTSNGMPESSYLSNLAGQQQQRAQMINGPRAMVPNMGRQLQQHQSQQHQPQQKQPQQPQQHQPQHHQPQQHPSQQHQQPHQQQQQQPQMVGAPAGYAVNGPMHSNQNQMIVTQLNRHATPPPTSQSTLPVGQVSQAQVGGPGQMGQVQTQQGLHNQSTQSHGLFSPSSLTQVPQGSLPVQANMGSSLSGRPDPEKRKLIQQQLVLLLHAHKCQRRERANGEALPANEAPCALPHCRTMKSVLQHMTVCQQGKHCTVPHCASSRQIIAHWRNCNKNDCPVCLPLKSASKTANPNQSLVKAINSPSILPPNLVNGHDAVPSVQQHPSALPASAQSISQPLQQPVKQAISGVDMQRAYAALGMNYNPGTGQITHQQNQNTINGGQMVIGTIQPSNNSQLKDWHKNVAIDLRNHLIHKLVQAIFPSPDPQVLKDPRMANLIQYARKVESEMYEAANSREEYYNMLAEKIYRIQKELEEKRRARLGSAGSGNARPPPQTNSLQPSITPSTGATMLPSHQPPAIVQQLPVQTAQINLSHQSLPQALLSPTNAATPIPSGIPVSQALEESRKDLQDALRRQHGLPPALSVGQQLQQTKVEVKVEVKAEAIETADTTAMILMSDVKKKETKPELKDEPKTPPPPAATKPAVPKKVFQPDELRQALMPVLERLYKLEESIPFRQPVDPLALNIPDYFDVIKHPMDLSTIKKKLDNGHYANPWDCVDDFWLMCENAWFYNKKTSRVYKWCMKVSEVFESEIDIVMQKLGYCCGRKQVFQPQTLCCYGKQLCVINRDQVYYGYENRYVYCEKCFEDIKTPEVDITDEMTGATTRVSKELFVRAKNDILDAEPWTTCTDCGRRMHSICVGHLDAIWPQGFTCDACLKAKGAKRKENRFTAKRLPSNRMATYIENRVNDYLRKKDVGAGEVIIRVLSSSDKETEVKPGMRERFPDMPASFPYHCKAFFAFEEVDGQEICFFGMHVQEYDSNAPAPNTGRIYISYLDSVHFFQPKEYRTAVYHEILIGYLDYCKQLGYNWGHIWACPPGEGDDYIFHCHPTEQKVPKPKRLQEWYKKMLDKAIIEGVVIDYKDIYKDAVEKNLQAPTEMPYFEGDFWPNVIEDSIKELDEEEQKRRREEEAIDDDVDEADGDSTADGTSGGKKNAKKGQQQKKKGQSKSKSATRKFPKKNQQSATDLSTKLFSNIEKHRDVFFVIKLQHNALSHQRAITDPDPHIACDLMDGRDAFLTMARERHWEFSSLRRTAWSTMCLLHEIHTSSRDAFVYSCNSCKAQVECRYHCKTCEDFDLCVPCYKKEGHSHEMEKLGLDVEDVSGNSQQTPAQARALSIQRCIQSLVHACQCRDANCKLPSCKKMSRVMLHAKSCKQGATHGCTICKQLLALCCLHAKSCREAKCPVPYCQSIKEKLKQQAKRERAMQDRHVHQRMMNMNGSSTATNTITHSVAAAIVVSSAVPVSHSSSANSLGSISQSSPSPYSGKPAPPVLRPPPNAMAPTLNSLISGQKQVHPNPSSTLQAPANNGISSAAPQQGNPVMQPNNISQMPNQGYAPHRSVQQLSNSGLMTSQGLAVEQWQQTQAQLHPLPQQGTHAPPMYGQQNSQHYNNQQLQYSSQQQQYSCPNGANQPSAAYNSQQLGGQQSQISQSLQHQQQTGMTMHPSGIGMYNKGPLQQQQQQATGQQPQVLGNTSQAVQKLFSALKAPHTPEQQHELMQILKSHPTLLAAFVKQKCDQKSQQQSQQQSHQQSQMSPRPAAPGGQMPAGQVQGLTMSAPQQVHLRGQPSQQEMWNRAPMQQPMYVQQQQQTTLNSSGYQMNRPNLAPPQYGVAASQQRYSASPQPGVRPNNAMLQQVRSPPGISSMSPQPMMSSPLHTPGMLTDPSLMPGLTPPPRGYASAADFELGQQHEGQLTPQEELSKFVESL